MSESINQSIGQTIDWSINQYYRLASSFGI